MKNKILLAALGVLIILLMLLPVLPSSAQAIVLMVGGVSAIFMHLENKKWCRNLDRVMAGEKNIKL